MDIQELIRTLQELIRTLQQATDPSIDEPLLQSLKNLDMILEANLFAVLAGLSLTAAAFLSTMVVGTRRDTNELRSAISSLETLDALEDTESANVAKEALIDRFESRSSSLERAKGRAVGAFYFFVLGLAAALGFDSVTEEMGTSFEATDVTTTGAALGAGMFYLGLAAAVLVNSEKSALELAGSAATALPRAIGEGLHRFGRTIARRPESEEKDSNHAEGGPESGE